MRPLQHETQKFLRLAQVFLRWFTRKGDQPVAPTNSDSFFAPFALFAANPSESEYYRPFAFRSCASCSRNDKSNSSPTFSFIPARFRSLAITFSIALAVISGRPGVT